MNGIFDLTNGITAGALRLGIKQGAYTGYVEAADSGNGFKYFIKAGNVSVVEGDAPDFTTAKQALEAELRALCSKPQ